MGETSLSKPWNVGNWRILVREKALETKAGRKVDCISVAAVLESDLTTYLFRFEVNMQTQPKNTDHQKVILDILVGNEWRHLCVTPKTARHYIRKWAHRGFTITPLPKE